MLRGSDFFRVGNRPLGAAAEPDTDTAGRHHDLFRDVNAEGADHRASLLLGLEHLLDPAAEDLANHIVKVGHFARPVLLPEKHLAVDLAQHLPGLVKPGHVHIQFGPHFRIRFYFKICCTHKSLLFFRLSEPVG